jgi:hypothetical protein
MDDYYLITYSHFVSYCQWGGGGCDFCFLGTNSGPANIQESRHKIIVRQSMELIGKQIENIFRLHLNCSRSGWLVGEWARKERISRPVAVNRIGRLLPEQTVGWAAERMPAQAACWPAEPHPVPRPD